MTIPELTEKAHLVADQYAKNFGVTCTDDWFLLKLQEELGEMTRAHLARTERTRHKPSSEQDAKDALAEEAVTKKWFEHLP